MSYSEIDIHALIDKYSHLAPTSDLALTHLNSIATSFKKTRNDWMKDSSLPIIAGGCIRDLVLGYYPKDFDCFLTPKSEDLDEEDVISLFMGELCTSSWDRKDSPEYFSKEFAETTFAVYEGVVEADGNLLQLIHRSFNSPEELVDTFDYALVKAYYNPETEKFYAHSDFLECLETKLITYDNEKTKQRLNSWRYRTGENSFKFIDKIKRKKNPFNWREINRSFSSTMNPCREILIKPY